MMAIEPQELENLELFLKGALSGAEAKALKRKLKEDQAFYAEAKSYAKLIHTLEQADPNRARVKAMVEAVPVTQSPKVIPLRPILSAVATFAILVVAIVWIIFAPRDTKAYRKLGFPAEIHSLQDQAEARSEAEMKFDKKRFGEAAKLFAEEYRKTKNRDLLFNYAVASLRAGHFQQAEVVFEKLAKSDYNHNQRAELFYAMSLYLSGKEEESKNAITGMLEDEGFRNKEEVRRLRAKIEKNKKK